MPHRTHLACISEYYTQHGRIISGERTWLELRYMELTGAERPVGITEMILALEGIERERGRIY